MRGLAAALLVLGLIRHQLWGFLPDKIQALAWNAAGAATITVLLLFSVHVASGQARVSKRSKSLYLVLGWWLYEEFSVMACSGIRIWWPSAVKPGQAQCDAITNLPVSSISLAIIATLAVYIHRETRDHDQS